MELVLLILVVVAILAYYGFMRSIEVGARMANEEVEFLADQHYVSLAERSAKLNTRISETTITEAAACRAKVKALRKGSVLNIDDSVENTEE